jgi:hypothetical protein
MILSRVGHELFYVPLARLKQVNNDPIRFFNTTGQLLAYLKEHADTDFRLEPVQAGQQLEGTNAAMYGPANGDIFCGQVRFDSATDAVVCS